MTPQTETTRSAPKLHRRQVSVLELFRRAGATYRQRQTLRRLDNDALKDVGLTAAQADAEASRPIWDVPTRWLR